MAQVYVLPKPYKFWTDEGECLVTDFSVQLDIVADELRSYVVMNCLHGAPVTVGLEGTTLKLDHESKTIMITPR